MTPGTILREARKRHGVSQASLARRAGTTQSAISRIESDRVSPRVQTLSSLLGLLGEELSIDAAPYDFGIDRSLITMNLDKDPSQRVVDALGFAEFVHKHQGMARR